MSFIKKMISFFGSKPKKEDTTTIKFELFGKEYSHTINATPEQVDEALKEYVNSDSFKQREKEHEKWEKIQQKRHEQFDIEIAISTTLKALYEIENSRYFTYQKQIDLIKENCNNICLHFKDGLYEKHKKGGIKKYSLDYEQDVQLPKSAHTFLSSPNDFKKNLKRFHKEQLLHSISYLYQYWTYQVSSLKQKAAKQKRQLYVLDGFIKLKNELSTLNPTSKELETVDTMIEKIKNEDWKLL